MKLRKSKLQLTSGVESKKNQMTTANTRSTFFVKKKTGDSDKSENKLEEILKKVSKNFKQSTQVVEFKKNTASILRTGAVVKNKMNSNDVVVCGLVAGSSDPKSVENHSKKAVELAHMKEIQEIERKHLIGLISLEEAKIAKIEAVKINLEIVKEMKLKRQRLVELMRHNQEQQTQKLKHIVRKTHLGRLKVRKNKFDALLQKKLTAGEVKKYSEKLQKELNLVKEKEFQEKLELIQKIKFLQKKSKSRKIETTKRDDYHRMSLLELKVSITKIRQQLEDEKEARQKKIQQEHERQKQLLNKAETLIEIRSHFQREIRIEKTKLDLEPTPELIKLREKLEQMRQITSKP